MEVFDYCFVRPVRIYRYSDGTVFVRLGDRCYSLDTLEPVPCIIATGFQRVERHEGLVDTTWAEEIVSMIRHGCYPAPSAVYDCWDGVCIAHTRSGVVEASLALYSWGYVGVLSTPIIRIMDIVYRVYRVKPWNGAPPYHRFYNHVRVIGATGSCIRDGCGYGREFGEWLVRLLSSRPARVYGNYPFTRLAQAAGDPGPVDAVT